MSNYSLPPEAQVATDTHVPRSWYESQRAALVRAEGRLVALQERITQLHKQLDAKSTRKPEPEREASPREAARPAPRPKAPAAKSNSVELTF